MRNRVNPWFKQPIGIDLARGPDRSVVTLNRGGRIVSVAELQHLDPVSRTLAGVFAGAGYTIRQKSDRVFFLSEGLTYKTEEYRYRCANWPCETMVNAPNMTCWTCLREMGLV